ncbi:sodium/potassium-transporting ATPase subunit beta-1-interacting protein [Culicoides brevitarsis]|uniref:sodium/potassium-transporting ATPase subunit beta-1-interacting protein n=1 Tax=Culicoides brevitarsis TaxID=469753 RepID=UPI00307B8504
MGFCTRRHFLLSICTLQLLLTIQRQVFDFLGYMWAPILTNFFHILFVIFGFFGAYQYRIKYLLSYSIWNVIWLGWNIFVICFYLNVGVLDRDTSGILNLGTGSVSWFEANGYGCKPSYSTNHTEPDPFKPPRPEQPVPGCLLDYTIVEIIQAGQQCLLAILGVIGAICIGSIFMDEDDSSGNLKKSKYRQSLYSVEFGPPVDTIRSRSRDALNNAPETLSPKPMTPRRIKRRSVMNRGTTNRTSTQSRRSHHSRSSHRSSRRKVHQSPVTKLLEQQQGGASTSAAGKNLPSFSRGAAGTSTSTSHLTESNLKSLNNDYGPVPGTSRTASDIVRHSPDPIYYNMTHNVSSPLPQDTSWSPSPPPGHYSTATTLSNQGGHSNPTYQHSTPNLSHSPEPMDEPYSNRPPSVRSSYSNFHGARPLSSYNPQTGTKENVFLGLTQHQQQQQVVQNPQPPPVVHAKPETHPIQATHKHEPFRPTKPAAIPPPTHPKPYAHVQPQAQMPPPQSPSPYQHLPQLPQKSRMAMASSRESMSSIAFINSGPPAYNLNYHTPPDSETTM